MAPKGDNKEAAEASSSGKNRDKGATSGERQSVERVPLPLTARAIVVQRNLAAERCPGCNSNVVPEISIRKEMAYNIVALVLCLLCLWPCACCVYCCPCGLVAYHICPNCGRVIRIQSVS